MDKYICPLVLFFSTDQLSHLHHAIITQSYVNRIRIAQGVFSCEQKGLNFLSKVEHTCNQSITYIRSWKEHWKMKMTFKSIKTDRYLTFSCFLLESLRVLTKLCLLNFDTAVSRAEEGRAAKKVASCRKMECASLPSTNEYFLMQQHQQWVFISVLSVLVHFNLITKTWKFSVQFSCPSSISNLICCILKASIIFKCDFLVVIPIKIFVFVGVFCRVCLKDFLLRQNYKAVSASTFFVSFRRRHSFCWENMEFTHCQTSPGTKLSFY